MTQQTAIANLRCNTLELLKQLRLKAEGGVCTDSDYKELKSNLISFYDTVYFDCKQELVKCSVLDTTLNNCSVNSNTCLQIFNPQVIITEVQGIYPYTLTLPLLTGVSYTWSVVGAGYNIVPLNNNCGITESFVHVCGTPFVASCIIRNIENSCSVTKSITLNQSCS